MYLEISSAYVPSHPFTVRGCPRIRDTSVVAASKALINSAKDLIQALMCSPEEVDELLKTEKIRNNAVLLDVVHGGPVTLRADPPNASVVVIGFDPVDEAVHGGKVGIVDVGQALGEVSREVGSAPSLRLTSNID